MLATCPRCRTSQATVRYDLGTTLIVRCSECRLLHLHPWPDPAETEAVYGSDYFQNTALVDGDPTAIYGYVDYIAERANRQRHQARIARELRSLLLPNSGRPRLLDVGCGLGYFLDEAFEEGFDPAGLEFNGHAVERLRQKFAFPILHGAIESVELEPESFDAITMFDVIEHLRDPFGSLDKLHRALRPGGVLVISTPDAESLTSRLIGSRLEDFRRTREHLVFFGRQTLREVLREHGFDPLSIGSIGHTFDLDLLLRRLRLYQPSLFGWLHSAVMRLGLGAISFQVNPRTKMICFARRRRPHFAQRATPLHQLASSADVAPQDRVLIDELHTLEGSVDRHYRWVADMIAPWLGRSVLEVGSGIGVISRHLLPRCQKLVLSDHKDIYLQLLRERFGDVPTVDFRLLDLNEPPYELAGIQVDTVVCLNVLEHLPDGDGVLRAFSDLLPSGGRLVLQVPNHPWLRGSLDDSYGHLRRYTANDLRRSLEAAGFHLAALRR